MMANGDSPNLLSFIEFRVASRDLLGWKEATAMLQPMQLRLYTAAKKRHITVGVGNFLCTVCGM